ncbi:MAG: Gfo/Idh/MocA family oxidoreductase [Pseudomonadales bacterium]|nr:Gfo/Idh/MocA family oxidoreductase [Pseudomonadales bacterium]
MIRFGTLGAARITPRALVYPCLDEPRATIHCVAARDRGRAEGFAAHHNIPVVCGNYDEVINHDRVDAIYNPLPISEHRDWTLKALAAGKHVLCEKSFASNAGEAEEMAEAAQKAGLVLMDAFHYRYHPLFIRAREIVENGMLGKVERVSAAFHVPVTDPGDIRMKYETGGGVTMDIGCYPISWVRHILADEPEEVRAEAETGPPDVDLMLKTTMKFPGGIEVETSGDMRETARFRADLTVAGSRGSMTVNNPLVPQIGNSIELEIDGKKTTETFDRRPTYGYQLDAFLDAVEQGKPVFTDADDAVRQMRVIDRCYEAAGLPVRGL